jgi:hypothetical protein
LLAFQNLVGVDSDGLPAYPNMVGIFQGEFAKYSTQTVAIGKTLENGR